MTADTLAEKPPRVPWGDFPDVLIHTSESAVKQHPAYRDAKTGDDEAALQLIEDTFDFNQTHQLERIAGDRRPTLACAHAYENEGVNAIPAVLTDWIAGILHWPADFRIVQVNVVAHTGADGFSRLARQAIFRGPVVPDDVYVIVDDFVGMGGTLTNLRGYIESHGGRVLAATTLTGKPYSAKLRLTDERLNELRSKHGKELEDWWQARFGHAFDALTESEARYLARSPDADVIRNRIAAAEQAGDRRAGCP